MDRTGKDSPFRIDHALSDAQRRSLITVIIAAGTPAAFFYLFHAEMVYFSMSQKDWTGHFFFRYTTKTSPKIKRCKKQVDN